MESSSLLCVALRSLGPFPVLFGSVLRIFGGLLRGSSFGLLEKLLAHVMALVAINSGGGVGTYASVASGLLGVLDWCFLASHIDGLGYSEMYFGAISMNCEESGGEISGLFCWMIRSAKQLCRFRCRR
jgi:hypothetical protein